MNPKEKLSIIEYKIEIYQAKLRYNKYGRLKVKNTKK